MQLFIWKPQGHGQDTVMVMEDSLEKAQIAADDYVKKQLDLVRAYSFIGWGTDYYQLEIHAQGEVVLHEND